jgi:arylsulfatase A-like enzyme
MVTSKKPNIVILISDAVRAKDLSLYGHSEENDYNLKKISRESIVFCNNFSASNASDASVTSLFSGQYPSTNGFIHQHPFMRESEIEQLRKNRFWLPIYLKEKGYSTISVTPLHLWFKKGFDFYKEEEHKKGGSLLNSPSIKRILLKLPNWMYSLGKKIIKVRASPNFYSCYNVLSLAKLKIKENKAKNKPFFLFMHLVDTHYPYPLIQKQKVDAIRTLDKVLKDIPSFAQKEYIKKRFTDIRASSFEEIEKRRDLSIKAVDKEIGKFYEFLKSQKLWDNTIFIIISDHGDNFGEHCTYFCRGGLYDPSIHTPFILHLPNFKGKRTEEITQLIDIPSTILEVLGDKKKIDGKSLMPLIKEQKKVRGFALSFDGFANNTRMVRTKDKKFIISDGSKCYLCGAVHNNGKEEYNLLKDPNELENIFSKKSNLEKFLKEGK